MPTAVFDLRGDPFAGAAGPGDSAGTADTSELRPAPAAADTAAWRPSPLLAIRRHWPVVALVAAAVFALAAVVVARKVAPVFRAEAVLHVQPVMPRVMYTDEEWRASSIAGFYNDHMRTLVQLAKERAVLEPAIAALERDGVPWMPDGIPRSEAANVLRARLETQIIRETNLLLFAFQDADPAVVAPVVNAVVTSFMLRIGEEQRADVAGKIDSLSADRARLVTELANVHGTLGTLSDQVGSALVDQRQNIAYERVRALEESHAKVLLRRADAEGALTAARGRAAELRAPVPAGLVERLVDDEPEVRDTRVTLTRLVLDHQQTVAGLAAGHPDRVRAEQRVTDARTEAVRTIEAARRRISERLRRERDEEAGESLARAEREYAAAVATESEVRARVEAGRTELAAFGRAMFDGAQAQSDHERIIGSLDSVDKRLEQLRTESQAPERISLRGDAVEPLRPVRDLRVTMIGASALGALVAGIAAALVLARLRSVVGSADDVAATGLELLAEMRPVDDPAAAAETLVRLHAGDGLDFRVLVLPVARGGGDAAVALAAATTLGAAAAEHRRTIVVDLLSDGGSLPDGSAPSVWRPRPAGASAAGLVASPSFRQRLDACAGDATARVVAAPSPLVSAAVRPFAADGYRAVLVAVRGTTEGRDLAEAANALRQAGGTVAGVVLAG